jgi:hypothetical protein
MQFTRYWHDMKIGVWCAVSCRQIITPIFYYEAVDSGRHIRSILEPFVGTGDWWWKTIWHFKRYSLTRSLVQDCGLQDRRSLVFVTFVGEPKKKNVEEHTSRCWSSPKWDKDCSCFDFGWWNSARFTGFLWRREACLMPVLLKYCLIPCRCPGILWTLVTNSFEAVCSFSFISSAISCCCWYICGYRTVA